MTRSYNVFQLLWRGGWRVFWKIFGLIGAYDLAISQLELRWPTLPKISIGLSWTFWVIASLSFIVIAFIVGLRRTGSPPEVERILQAIQEVGEKDRRAMKQLGDRVSKTQAIEPEPNKFLSIEKIKEIIEKVTDRQIYLLSNYGETLGNVAEGSKQTFSGLDPDLGEPVVFNLFGGGREIGYGGIIVKHVNNDIEAQFFAYIHTISIRPITIGISVSDQKEEVSFTSHLVPTHGKGCFIQVNRAPASSTDWEEKFSLLHIEISS